jgi:hypothetical protein
MLPPRKHCKILYFTKGMVPTDEELAEAEALGTKAFRCSRFVGITSPIEKCEAVYGDVPKRYKDYFSKLVVEDEPLDFSIGEIEEVTAKVEVTTKPKSKKPAWKPT